MKQNQKHRNKPYLCSPVTFDKGPKGSVERIVSSTNSAVESRLPHAEKYYWTLILHDS